MNPIDPSDLQQRRQDILHMALREADARRHRRWMARAGGVGVIAIVLFSLIRFPNSPQTNSPQPSNQIVINYIQTDPNIVQRLAAPPVTPAWTSIGDDELLKTLADAGQPGGLVYMNGQAALLK